MLDDKKGDDTPTNYICLSAANDNQQLDLFDHWLPRVTLKMEAKAANDNLSFEAACETGKKKASKSSKSKD